MTWAKLDQDFHTNPKILSVSPAAAMLYTAALTYSNKHQTRGIIHADQVSGIYRPYGRKLRYGTLATELVRVGLWHDQGSGVYQINDYFEYQPTPEQVEARRAAAANRQARKRAKERAAAALNDHREKRAGERTVSKSRQNSVSNSARIAHESIPQVIENTEDTHESHAVTYAAPDPDPDLNKIHRERKETVSLGEPHRVTSLSLVKNEQGVEAIGMNSAGVRAYVFDRMGGDASGGIGKMQQHWWGRLEAAAATRPFSTCEVDAAIEYAREVGKNSGGFVAHRLLEVRANGGRSPLRADRHRPDTQMAIWQQGFEMLMARDV